MKGKVMRIGHYTESVPRWLKWKRRVLVVGKPGVGKTVGKMEACAREGVDYIGVCTPLADPAFIQGYPIRDNGGASFAPFDQIAKALNASKPTLLDFDEIGGATETVIKAALRLFQFGEVGGKKLPECVTLGASTNDVGHGAGVMGLLEPMKDRFHTIINVEENLEDTVSFGLARGWPSDLLAFLRNSPDSLMDWKPTRNMQKSGSTPRAWGDVADWINLGEDDSEIICGAVGKAAGTKYLAFRGLINDLPDIDGVLMNPDTAPVPENPSARYLVAMALASRMNGSNFGQAATYLHRLPAMFEAFAVRDALRAESQKRADNLLPKGYQVISSGRDFVAWSVTPVAKSIQSA